MIDFVGKYLIEFKKYKLKTEYIYNVINIYKISSLYHSFYHQMGYFSFQTHRNSRREFSNAIYVPSFRGRIGE